MNNKIKLKHNLKTILSIYNLKALLVFYRSTLNSLSVDIDILSRKNSLVSVEQKTALEKCVLALEDRHYYKHKGIDYRFIPRVVRQFITGKRIGGVSTIEQQYVRTYLNRRERTFSRKLNEIILARLINKRRNKTSILRAYLSCAYFGYKLESCDAVSNKIFSKNASCLTINEAALIASLLVYPLPAKIINKAISKGLFPIKNIECFFNFAINVYPNWSNRVYRRWSYAIRLIKNF